MAAVQGHDPKRKLNQQVPRQNQRLSRKTRVTGTPDHFSSGQGWTIKSLGERLGESPRTRASQCHAPSPGPCQFARSWPTLAKPTLPKTDFGQIYCFSVFAKFSQPKTQTHLHPEDLNPKPDGPFAPPFKTPPFKAALKAHPSRHNHPSGPHPLGRAERGPSRNPPPPKWRDGWAKRQEHQFSKVGLAKIDQMRMAQTRHEPFVPSLEGGRFLTRSHPRELSEEKLRFQGPSVCLAFPCAPKNSGHSIFPPAATTHCDL